MGADAQTPRNISYRISPLGDLMNSVMLKIVTVSCITHNSLLASFFRDKVSRKLGAIQGRTLSFHGL